MTPAVQSTTMPGVGAVHRRWMADYGRTGFLVNTIGSPSDGSIDAAGKVAFSVHADQMSLIHETLALMINLYLHAGAEAATIAGMPREHFEFTPQWKGREADIARKIAWLAPTAEYLALASGHPQGGLPMNRDPERGAVGDDYRVHGFSNCFVSDASLFPTTITINPQWLVMALGHTAGEGIKAALQGAR